MPSHMACLNPRLPMPAVWPHSGIRLKNFWSVYSTVIVVYVHTKFVSQKFYLRGLKLVNTHRKQAGEMRARVKAGGKPLSRWEKRFIETYQKDVIKYVSFLC